MADIFTDIGSQPLLNYIYAVHDYLNMDRFEDAEIIVEATDRDDGVCGAITGDLDEVTIEVDLEQEWDHLLTVIAHEMVHACQLLSGRLVQGIKCSHFEGVRTDKLPYNERPEELEAYLIEEFVKQSALKII